MKSYHPEYRVVFGDRVYREVLAFVHSFHKAARRHDPLAAITQVAPDDLVGMTYAQAIGVIDRAIAECQAAERGAGVAS